MSDPLAAQIRAVADDIEAREVSRAAQVDLLTGQLRDTEARITQFRDTRWKPALLAWDGYPEVRALGTTGTYDAISGIGNKMGTNGGYRSYRNLLDAVWDPAGQEAATLALYGGRGVTLDCVWPGSSTVTSVRYGNATYQNAVSGAYDADMRAYVQSLPIGRNRRASAPFIRKIVCPWHEMDGYSPADVDRSLARGAVKRLVGVAIREALAMGAHPGEFGAGGLLTGSGMDDYQRWGWWHYGLDADLLNSGMLVGAFDTYYKVEPDPSGVGTRAPNIRVKLDRFTSRLAAAGITRYVLAETAMGFDTYAREGVEVGTVDNLIDFTNQLRDWLLTTGEVAATFTKPDGPASRYGSYTRPGREAALSALASAMAAVNR